MAEYYTLEEAARVLGMSPEELRDKALQGDAEIKPYTDGDAPPRFRVVDVDELARRQGLGSDAELRLSDLDAPAIGETEDLEELDLSEFQLGVAKPDLGAETAYFPTSEGEGSDHDVVIDDLSVPPSPVTGSSSVIIGMHSGGKQPSDSDVRLVPEDRDASDSDVRLAAPDSSDRLSDSDVTLIKDDTTEHGLMAADSDDDADSGTGSSASETVFRPSPVPGSSAEVSAAGTADDSDFELSPASDLVDALEPESGSDFELGAIDDLSDEFEVTPLKPSDSDVTAADPNLSGINLSRPSDSGINLLGPDFDVGAESIELAPLSDDDLPTSQASPSAPTPPAAASASVEKDIFEDTDFEVDASFDDDSDDKTVQIQAGSDFDMDSGSEVFALDEEDVDINAATAMAPSAFAEEDDEDDDGFEDVVADEVASAWAADDSDAVVTPSQGMVISREATADWDGLAVGLLAVASLFIFLSAFLAYDLVQNLYEFNEGGPASGIVESISGMFFQ